MNIRFEESYGNTHRNFHQRLSRVSPVLENVEDQIVSMNSTSRKEAESQSQQVRQTLMCGRPQRVP